MITRLTTSIVRLCVLALPVTLLTGCAFLPWFNGGMDIAVVQRSEYCGTQSPDAALHYFATPGAFSRWIARRNIHDLRPGVASLHGALVVEMGRRHSTGYAMQVDRQRSDIVGNTFVLFVNWQAPGIDAQAAQVMVSPCMVVVPPPGDYETVVLRDQNGAPRGKVSVR